jgi:hypothetical protein
MLNIKQLIAQKRCGEQVASWTNLTNYYPVEGLLLKVEQSLRCSTMMVGSVSGTAVRYSKKQTLVADEIRLPASGC